MDPQPPIPPRLVLKNFAAGSWMPLIALIPLVISLLVYASTALEDWRMPLLGIALMTGVAFVISGLFMLAARWWEIRNIKRVYAGAWAVFPQYKSEEQWRRFIQKDHERRLENHHFEWTGLLIVTVVVIVIGFAGLAGGAGGAGDAGDAGDALILALVGFEVFVVALVAGRWLRQKLDIHARYKRRLQMAPPNVIISKMGKYHEDQGFESLGGLKATAWKEATKSRPAKIIFTLRAPLIGYLADDTYGIRRTYSTEVEILKENEREAKALVERFQKVK